MRAKDLFICVKGDGVAAPVGGCVRQRIADIAERGMGVVLISTDLDELMALSDRIAVMEGGRIRGIVENDGTGETLRLRIGRMMAGEEEHKQATV